MIISQEAAPFTPVTVTFTTLEEFKHFIASISISDNDLTASARTCGFTLADNFSATSQDMWDSTQELRKCIPGCA